MSSWRPREHGRVAPGLTESGATRVTESEIWSWRHFSLDRRSPGYCRVTFAHPPINTITATTVEELGELVGLIEQDADLNVVVFASANPDFYLAHYDAEHDPSRTLALGVGPTGMHAWLDLLVRLSRAPVVSIASIRGRARGAGSEFVLACDLRFASRQNTLIGQFEVGMDVVPGGGPMARLSRLVDGAEPSRSCWLPTISTGRGRSSMGMSTGSSMTTGSTTRSRRSHHDSRASTTTRSRAQRHTSIR